MNRQGREAGKVKEGEERIEKKRAQQGPRSHVSTLQMTNRGLISKVTDGEAHSEQSTCVNVRSCVCFHARFLTPPPLRRWSLPTLVLARDNPNGGGSGLLTLLEELSHRSRSVMPLKSLSKEDVRFWLISPLKRIFLSPVALLVDLKNADISF